MVVDKSPVQNSTVSFWRSIPEPLDNYQSTPELPSTVDVVIIGAGYAGVSVVHHMLELFEEKNIPVPSTLILEAREACSGASGRNGGHVKPDPYAIPAKITRSHGIEAGIECADFEYQHISALKKLIEDESIDCDFVLTRCVEVFLTQTLLDQTRTVLEELSKKHVFTLNDVQLMSGTRAEQLSGVKGAKGCITFTAGHMHPYKLILHLLSKALNAGINLQTHTPVQSVSTVPDEDGYLTVITERGAVRAKKVVYATNAYTAALLPEFEDKIIPVRGMCSHIVPKKRTTLLENSYTIRRSTVESEYLVPRADGSIVVGGGRGTYYHNKARWYDNVKDDELIEEAKPYLSGYMQRNFHGWEDSQANPHKVWTGIMGHSADGVPFVGTIPGRKSQFIIAGFSGHGMPQAFLAAKGLVSMMIDGAAFQETGLPRVFESTGARLGNSRNIVLESWEDWSDAESFRSWKTWNDAEFTLKL